jgi:hypothetical protein
MKCSLPDPGLTPCVHRGYSVREGHVFALPIHTSSLPSNIPPAEVTAGSVEMHLPRAAKQWPNHKLLFFFLIHFF